MSPDLQRRDTKVAIAVTGLILAGLLYLQVLSGSAVRYDFSSYYVSGWMVRNSDPAKLYDLDEQSRAQQAVFQRSETIGLVHPAFEAVLFAPLTHLSYATAYVLWGLLNILLWLWFVQSMRQSVNVPQQPFQYLLLCFTFFPLWIAFLQGGTSLALVAVYGLVYHQLKRDRDFVGGVILGLGLFRFHLVLPFAAIFALRGKWKFLTGFMTTALCLGFVSFAAVGWEGTLGYIRFLMGMLTNPGHEMNAIAPFSIMTTLRAFLLALSAGYVSTFWINSISVLASISLIFFTGYRWRRDDQSGRKHQDVLFAASIGVAMITGVYSLIHDLSVMLVPILLVVPFALLDETRRVRQLLTGCVLLLYALPVLLLLLNHGHGLYLVCPVIIVFVLTVFRTSLAASLQTVDLSPNHQNPNQPLPNVSL